MNNLLLFYRNTSCSYRLTITCCSYHIGVIWVAAYIYSGAGTSIDGITGIRINNELPAAIVIRKSNTCLFMELSL